MTQEFVLEVICDVSFHEHVKTKKGTVKRFRYREQSNFFKLHRKTLKSIQKEIDLIIKKFEASVVNWKIYTSFPFE